MKKHNSHSDHFENWSKNGFKFVVKPKKRSKQPSAARKPRGRPSKSFESKGTRSKQQLASSFCALAGNNVFVLLQAAQLAMKRKKMPRAAKYINRFIMNKCKVIVEKQKC